MLTQDLLVVMLTILAAAIAVEDAAPRRGPQGDGHFQRLDRQIAYRALADRPADDAPQSPLVSAIRAASLRNSSVLPVRMVHLLCCALRAVSRAD